MGAIGRKLINMTQQPLIHYTAMFENSPPRAGKCQKNVTRARFGPKIGIIKKITFYSFHPIIE